MGRLGLGEGLRLGGLLVLGLPRDWRGLRRGRGERGLGDTFWGVFGVGGRCATVEKVVVQKVVMLRNCFWSVFYLSIARTLHGGDDLLYTEHLLTQ